MSHRFPEIHEAIDDLLRPGRIVLTQPFIQNLNSHWGFDLTMEELGQFLLEASDAQVQPLAAFIDSALHTEGGKIRPNTETDADSEERLEWILGKLELSSLRKEIVDRLPEPEPSVIVDGDFLTRYRDWYTPEVESRNSHYWDDYVRVLNRKGWGADSIRTVNDQAREVMRRIEDPTAEHYLSSRGLVVGYVQSGKTANFTAVAAKAIDAGYRFIIVLAGTLDNLRNQTQRRLDKELFGREAVLSGLDEDTMTATERKAEAYFNGDRDWELDWETEGQGFVVHGARTGNPGFPKIRRITTSIKDFQGSRGGANPLNITVPHRDLPVHDPRNLDDMPCVVAVVKKHKTVLEKLNSEIRRAKNFDGVLSDLPVLIIDDESDQASINTKDNRKKRDGEERDRTAVNDQITKLLENLPRSQYLGYTATPFANVFVDPSDPADLYPRDFVLMLNEPPAYRGAKWFHDRMDFADNPADATIGNSNSKAFLRELNEEDFLDEYQFEETRKRELQEALDMFVLTGGIKKFREDMHEDLRFKHHTMLVHEAVDTKSHSVAKKLLGEQWKQRGYSSGGAWAYLEKLYDTDVYPVISLARYNDDYAVPESFTALKPYILEAVEEILEGVERGGEPILQVDTVGNDTPNFEEGKVWKVMVGGAKLSRGYTVEGLTVSYFRRRTGGADTLMQTGRWFGFRQGYQDLVRLYCPLTLAEAFEASMNDEENFRDNIKAYADLTDDGQPKLTPMQLAPLVQQTLPDLSPTSRNKMFNAYLESTACAPSITEFFTIPTRKDPKLSHNFREVGIPLLKVLDSKPNKFAYFRIEGSQRNGPVPSAGSQILHSGTIGAKEFVELLEKMKWNSDTSFEANKVRPAVRYLKELIGTGGHADPASYDFSEVAVLLPTPKNARTIDIPGIDWPVPLVKRRRRDLDSNGNASSVRHDITGNDRKHSYIVENIAMGNPATRIKPRDWQEFGAKLQDRGFTPIDGPEPFDMGESSQTRGAVLLTIFDDRDIKFLEEMEKSGTWTPPSFENNEVGLALAVNSPHKPILNGEEVYTWRVLVPTKSDSATVDVREVETASAGED